MTTAKQLSKRQLAVIDDIFDGGLEEPEILKKHKLSRRLYDKWLADGAFNGHCDRRMAWEHRRSKLTLARNARSAASRLVHLTGSTTPETARKACLDIISMRPADQRAEDAVPGDAAADNNAESPPELSPETAGRLLAVLAQEQ